MGYGARWLRSLLVVAVAAAGLTVSGVARAETVSRTVFSDGFDGPRGTGVDTAKWAGDTGGPWLDGDGHLVLGSWLSSTTTFTQAGGHASARIRAGRTDGPWATFGILGDRGQFLSGSVETLGGDEAGDYDFHTYAIDWTRTSFVWSVDGRQVLRLTPDVAGQPFRLALNLGGGGQYSSGILVDSVSVTVPTVVAKPWKKYTTYQVGDHVSYRGATYRVKAVHTALPGWQPGRVPALFEKL
ncbi:family 16 glycosylhydrolase [Actinoplanes oblitus]|uniref:Family 16 glycosylhydrolase n=1 Tax=Actinoplanes oblitus TaxID=3040509 RepID=A0ABY8WF26_9ACTN|nr:carbohydrate-binding protein [Actinoplanes oblitus]WIM95716.1 family 16 glycosylhydrolase [Actinoplanes oblitus]